MTKKHEQTKRIKRAAAKAKAQSSNVTYLPQYRSAKALQQWEEAKESNGHPLIVDHGDLILGSLLLLTDSEKLKVNEETISLTKEDGMLLLHRWFMKTAAKQIEDMRKPKLSLVTETDETLTDEAPTDGGPGSVGP